MKLPTILYSYVAGKYILTTTDNTKIYLKIEHWAANRIENDLIKIKKEIERLREGNFTEEEFQNLCHNFSPDDKCRFQEGCREYQKKLFGE